MDDIRICGEQAKHVIDLDLTVARTGPHDGGAGRAADVPGRPEVGGHPPEEITTKDSCGEALRQTLSCRRLRTYTLGRSASSRPRTTACGAARAYRQSAAPTAVAEAGAGNKPREKALGGGRGTRMKKSSR